MCIKIIIKTIKRGASDTMKFILFLLSFLYVNDVALAEEKEKVEFVNPVFNQPLRPMSMR